MTTRNYDTRNHKPYPRIVRIEIDYDKTGTPRVDYYEQMAVVDGNNNVQHLDTLASRYNLDLAKIVEPVPLVNPATGEAIPGQSVTSQQVMLSLLAFLRADQLRRDAE
jgi:uncharacterized membrane protein